MRPLLQRRLVEPAHGRAREASAYDLSDDAQPPGANAHRTGAAAGPRRIVPGVRAWRPRVGLSLLIVVTAARAAAEPPPDLPCKQLKTCQDRCAHGEKKICALVDGIKAYGRASELACEAGDIQKCVEMAVVYESDSFFAGQVEPDIVTHLQERACAGGHGDSCANLGAVYAAGTRVPRNDAQAIATWKKGCELKSGHACMSVGNRYRFGRGVARDPRLATTYLEQSCTLGSADGCFSMGGVAAELRTGSRARVRQYYERGCKLGSGWSCIAARSQGSAVSNPAVESQLLASEGKLCDLGYPVNCNNVGVVYEDGIGVPRDPVRAAQFRARACDQDFGPACSELASATLAGVGVQRSPADAMALYEKACGLEDYPSCDTLGGLLIEGTKLPADSSRGIELCTRACEHGQAASCRRLADAYAAGRGVERDPAAAKRHRERACALGDRTSCGKAKR